MKKTWADWATAANPGDLRLSEEKLRVLHPEYYGLKGLAYTVIGWLIGKRGGMAGGVQDRLRRGDTQPAVVVSTAPLLVAAFSDDLDCVALLGFPDEFVATYQLSEGSRLLTVNCYSARVAYSSDLILGPNHSGTWTAFFPTIAEFFSDDACKIDARKKQIAEEEWGRTHRLGKEYLLERPGTNRDGRPGLSGYPPEILSLRQIGFATKYQYWRNEQNRELPPNHVKVVRPPGPPPLPPRVVVGADNFAGIGSHFYGECDFCSDGTYVVTKWFVVLWFPLIPQGSHRFLRLPKGLPSVPGQINGDFGFSPNCIWIERAPMHWWQVLRVYAFLPFVLGGDLGLGCAPSFLGTSWIHILGPQGRLVAFLLMLLPFVGVWWSRRAARKRAGVDAIGLGRRVLSVLPEDLRAGMRRDWQAAVREEAKAGVGKSWKDEKMWEGRAPEDRP